MYKTFAVVLNWNNADDTLRCVHSLRTAKNVPDEIIVVDNGSTDSSEFILRTQLRGICHIIQTGHNLGYAGGMRIGADYCLANNADLVWFLNNDTVVLPDTLSELLASVERNGLWCMYSPRILYLSDQNRVYFAGLYLDPVTGNFGVRPLSRPLEYGGDQSDLISDVIQGASFLVPACIIRELGFMDEDYFLYYEEYDYSFRLAQHGVKCICALSAVVLHKREGTSCSNPLVLDRIRAYYRVRNQMLFWQRCCAPAQARRFIWRHILRQIKLLVRAKGFKDPTVWVRLVALWHGMIGESGRVYYPG